MPIDEKVKCADKAENSLDCGKSYKDFDEILEREYGKGIVFYICISMSFKY